MQHSSLRAQTLALLLWYHETREAAPTIQARTRRRNTGLTPGSSGSAYGNTAVGSSSGTRTSSCTFHERVPWFRNRAIHSTCTTHACAHAYQHKHSCQCATEALQRTKTRANALTWRAANASAAFPQAAQAELTRTACARLNKCVSGTPACAGSSAIPHVSRMCAACPANSAHPAAAELPAGSRVPVTASYHVGCWPCHPGRPRPSACSLHWSMTQLCPPGCKIGSRSRCG